jgi:hypothetical protein
MYADTLIDFTRVRESLLPWPQSKDCSQVSYRKFTGVRGWRANLEILAVLASVPASALVESFAVKEVGIRGTGHREGNRIFTDIPGHITRVITDSKLLGIPGFMAFGKARVTQLAVGFIDVETNGTPSKISRSHQCCPAPVKRINNKFALMRKEFDSLFYEGNGECYGVHCLVSNITLLIGKAPHAELVFNPLLCSEAIEVTFSTSAGTCRANI